MTSEKENRKPFLFIEKDVHSLSNTALDAKSEILLKFKDRLENVEIEFDMAKEELKAQNSKIEKLRKELQIKENDCKTLEIKLEDLNGNKKNYLPCLDRQLPQRDGQSIESERGYPQPSTAAKEEKFR